MPELRKNKALAKKNAIEEFKSSNDFQDAVESLAGKYFGKGFDFYKRQVAYHHPNLGINLDNMGIDHDLLNKEEDEAGKKGKNKDKGEGKCNTSHFSH